MTELKLVKTNERTEEYNKPASKWSSRTVKATRKTHDLELHHSVTGEPIFSVKPGYGKGKYELSWHPYMKETHPGLEHSFEHGSRHHAYSRMHVEGGKESLPYGGGQIYKEAATAGFRDKLHVTTEKKHEQEPGSDYVKTTTINKFHDPDTGDHIATEHHDNYGNRKITYNKDYLDKHGIDHGVATNMKAPDGYRFARGVMKEKGKDYHAIGRKYYGDSKNGTHVYDVAKGKAPEQVSAAHEAYIRKEHGEKPGFKLERHGPTAFTASHKSYDGEYADDVHHTSVMSGDKLHHHKNTVESSTYQGNASSHKF